MFRFGKKYPNKNIWYLIKIYKTIFTIVTTDIHLRSYNQGYKSI